MGDHNHGSGTNKDTNPGNGSTQADGTDQQPGQKGDQQRGGTEKSASPGGGSGQGDKGGKGGSQGGSSGGSQGK